MWKESKLQSAKLDSVLCTVVEFWVLPGDVPWGRGGQLFCVGGNGREVSHMCHGKSEKKIFMAWTCMIEKKMTC